jgi:hypothetical protein
VGAGLARLVGRRLRRLGTGGGGLAVVGAAAMVAPDRDLTTTIFCSMGRSWVTAVPEESHEAPALIHRRAHDRRAGREGLDHSAAQRGGRHSSTSP